MKCTQCGNELTEDMFSSGMCFVCGQAVTISEKIILEQIKAKEQNLKEQIKTEQKSKEQELINRYNAHMLTTGYSFEGYHIKRYLGLVSGETVIGTGFLADIVSNVSDIFGTQVPEYSDKIKLAKNSALSEMIRDSTSHDGNAIIGITYSYLRFARDVIGVSVNGTSVKIEKIF